MLFILLFPGCTAQRYVAPSLMDVAETAPADLTHVAIRLQKFDITNQSETDYRGNDKREEMERAFIGRLQKAASIGLYTTNRMQITPPKELDDVRLYVSLSVEETADRTIVFDGLFFYPFLGTLPLTPQWGEAIAIGKIELSRNGRPLEPILVRISAPYSILFYSWYRTGPIEEAFARAHQKLYDELFARLIPKIGERIYEEEPVLVATTTAATSTAAELILASAGVTPLPKIKKQTSALSALPALMASIPANIILPPDEVGVIFRPVHRESEPGWLSQYLGALGGIEASMTGGKANVQSRATTAGGARETVGTGQAVSSGYRLSLFKPPSVTGFFFPPLVGFLQQTITISGFRDDVPLFTPEGSSSIPAVVSDPTTGGRVDLGEPISYRLKLRSGHIGQGAGLNLVIGNDDVQLFSTLSAGLNVFEVRHSDVQFFRTRVKGMSVAAFQSGNFSAQLGLAIPDWHVAIRAAGQLEWYASFRYPEDVEFQARSVFNSAKQIYERERVLVTGASLTTIDWQLSVVALF
jgi:hypothetical protein